MCQNRKQQIVFLECKCWMAATYTKKIKHSMLCVTGVDLRDILTLHFFNHLHSNVSHLWICSFLEKGGGGDIGSNDVVFYFLLYWIFSVSCRIVILAPIYLNLLTHAWFQTLWCGETFVVRAVPLCVLPQQAAGGFWAFNLLQFGLVPGSPRISSLRSEVSDPHVQGLYIPRYNTGEILCRLW